MVCLRNVSVDTLHKGDTEDDNVDDDDDNNNNNNNNKFIYSLIRHALSAKQVLSTFYFIVCSEILFTCSKITFQV